MGLLRAEQQGGAMTHHELCRSARSHAVHVTPIRVSGSAVALARPSEHHLPGVDAAEPLTVELLHPMTVEPSVLKEPPLHLIGLSSKVGSRRLARLSGLRPRTYAACNQALISSVRACARASQSRVSSLKLWALPTCSWWCWAKNGCSVRAPTGEERTSQQAGTLKPAIPSNPRRRRLRQACCWRAP